MFKGRLLSVVRSHGFIFIVAFLLRSTPAVADNHSLTAPLFKDLGPFHSSIKTTSKLAQRYYDQGMLFFWGFDYAESVRSLHAATVVDPHCAMCYVGYALALGSKTNALINGQEITKARQALQKAKQVVSPDDQLTKGLIAALNKRYKALPDERFYDQSTGRDSTHDDAYPGASFYIQKSGHLYISIPKRNAYEFWVAMQALSLRFPTNADVAVLMGFANIDLTDWNFWTDLHTPHPNTVLMLVALKKALVLNPNHPGALHLYQHAVAHNLDLRNTALPMAEHLAKLYPHMEHLAHMVSHLYLSQGQYARAIAQNRMSIANFEAQNKQIKAQGFQPEFNALQEHNYDFLVNAALLSGHQHAAMVAAKNVAILAKPWVEKIPSMARFAAMPYWVQAHFGLWQQANNQPKPQGSNHYLLALWHYVRGLAQAHHHHLSAAQLDLNALTRLAAQPLPDEDNLYSAKHLLIAQHVLAANIARMKGETVLEIHHWNQALQFQEELGAGTDPPSWYLPCAEGLGYAQLHAGHYKRAIAAFVADLSQFPSNPWSKKGLAIALLKASTSIQETETMTWQSSVINQLFGIDGRDDQVKESSSRNLPTENEFLFSEE